MSGGTSPGVATRQASPGASSRPFYWHWYHLPVWRQLRRQTLAAHPVCRFCGVEKSTIADHIEPHRGSWKLFTDTRNLQGLCQACHNGRKLRIEQDIIRDTKQVNDGWLSDGDGWLVRRRTAGEKRRASRRRRR